MVHWSRSSVTVLPDIVGVCLVRDCASLLWVLDYHWCVPDYCTHRLPQFIQLQKTVMGSSAPLVCF